MGAQKQVPVPAVEKPFYKIVKGIGFNMFEAEIKLIWEGFRESLFYFIMFFGGVLIGAVIGYFIKKGREQ